MALSRGELWFAPGCRMADVDLDDPGVLVDNFRDRVLGFFIEPVRYLRTMGPEENTLFSSALICAATIEVLAHSDPLLIKCERPISEWLIINVAEFEREVRGKTAAAFFEERFRNGLVHEGYIASLGRLGTLDQVVTIDEAVVTVNPFLLNDQIAESLDRFHEELKSGQRNIRAFQSLMKTQFEDEVNSARADAG